jgi:hypothetical protein
VGGGGGSAVGRGGAGGGEGRTGAVDETKGKSVAPATGGGWGGGRGKRAGGGGCVWLCVKLVLIGFMIGLGLLCAWVSVCESGLVVGVVGVGVGGGGEGVEAAVPLEGLLKEVCCVCVCVCVCV